MGVRPASSTRKKTACIILKTRDTTKVAINKEQKSNSQKEADLFTISKKHCCQ